jgi:diacylglycerol kinase family enzyme
MNAACQTIIEGRTRVVDVGKMNDRFFLGTAGAGYDGLVVKLFEEKWASRRGLLPYLHVAVRGFFEHRVQPVRLKLNGRQLTVFPLLVTAANTTQFGGRAIIAPQAKPDDGLLDLCVIHNLTFLQAVYHWPKVFRGCIDRMSHWEVYRTASVDISSKTPLAVHVDGEPVEQVTHLKIDVLPQALRILVPKAL